MLEAEMTNHLGYKEYERSEKMEKSKIAICDL
jgi:transposase-like protein